MSSSADNNPSSSSSSPASTTSSSSPSHSSSRTTPPVGMQLGMGMLTRTEFESQCELDQSVTLAGNRYSLIGMALGVTLSFLAPNKWTPMQKYAPFLAMGLSGIGGDYFAVKGYCQGLPSPPNVIEQSVLQQNKLSQNKLANLWK